jgi:hypothetical protein
MKFLIEVEAERVEGRNLPASELAEHLCKLIQAGELPTEPGNVWVGGDAQGRGPVTQYRIIRAARA